MAALLEDAGKHEKAALLYDKAIANDGNPLPELFKAQFENFQFIQPLPITRMEKSLQKGLARHGDIISLLQLMIDLYQQTGQVEAALTMIDRLP